MFGPRRFGELRADLPGISANVLTQRLERLEAVGIVTRARLPRPASAQGYGLTPWGYEAEAVVKILGRWAARSPGHDPTLPLSAASLMLSFRTMFDAGRADGFVGTIGFAIGDDRFVVTVADGRIPIARGEPAAAAVIVSGSATAIASVVYGGRPADAAIADGALSVAGDRATFDRFATFFPLPQKAGAPT